VTETGTETERHRDRDRKKQRQRDRETDRDRQTDTEGGASKRGREGQTQSARERQRPHGLTFSLICGGRRHRHDHASFRLHDVALPLFSPPCPLSRRSFHVLAHGRHGPSFFGKKMT
jgi:hypothetical protein